LESAAKNHGELGLWILQLSHVEDKEREQNITRQLRILDKDGGDHITPMDLGFSKMSRGYVMKKIK
jgi:hypothetical protein